MRFRISLGHTALVLGLSALAPTAYAQSFRVQCPTSTITHPDPKATGVNNAEPAYTGPTTLSAVPVTTDPTSGKQVGGYLAPSANVNGAIKCQQISGGDGYATMADGTQTYMFSFGPLSGLADIAAGKPGTQFPNIFNGTYTGTPSGAGNPLMPGDPATTNGAFDNSGGYSVGAPGSFTFNGAVGLVNDLAYIDTIYDISEGPSPSTTVTVLLNGPSSFKMS